jgi:EAL domain-containing protein (putative c-di-GMP-specific phosphodiesterase class I)/CheY-like chemotaxis protein
MEHPRNLAAAPSTLLYQPRFDCRSGLLSGVHASLAGLDRGDGTFLDNLSGAGLMALREACVRVAGWSESHGRPLALTLGAHIEVLCLPEFATQLHALLVETRLPPQSLELEIVTLYGDISEAGERALQQLKNCGVRFTLSAASPACAHLAWTRRLLPLDGIEVPSRLVDDVAADPEGVAIIRALVTRAHKLGLSVCAKDVGASRTASVMVATGCDLLQGALFGLPLPAAEFEALLAADTRLDNAHLRGPRPERTLLLVDDEENILSSLRRLLRRDGYTILTATGGLAALELLATHPVDVIISDQRMPGMTGVEFLRKAKDMHPDSVRLVLSGYTDLQSVTDAINEGAIYKFLTKPWDDAMLRANIEEAFRRKLLADDNRRLSSRAEGRQRGAGTHQRTAPGGAGRPGAPPGMEEAALSMTQEALAVPPLPLIGIDPSGMIAFANDAAERLFARQGAAARPGRRRSPAGGAARCSSTPAPASRPCAAGTRLFRVEAHPLGGQHGERGLPAHLHLSKTCQT